ncbi:MAG: oligopeptidase A [Gammaproteobacteria bacterium]|nr:oligopeptidase A [Gammaproteobacteria bacterium]
MTDNPLLKHNGLPCFDQIRPEHVEPAIDQVLAENRQAIAALLAMPTPHRWSSLVRPLERLGERLSRTWAPVAHMNAVVNSAELRAVYNACLPKISAYTTELGQNSALYQAYCALAEGPEYARLTPPQRKLLDNTLRDFRLSGVALTTTDKDRYKDLMQQISELHARFEQNLLDATHAWTTLITDERELAGIPESSRGLMLQAAAHRGLQGWLVTLEFPCYIAVMTYADSRELRRQVYTAYVTRASDAGPDAGRWDNSEVMARLLELRHAEAQLLGFANYAERSLATKMAQHTQDVVTFLRDLARRSLPIARQEMDELRNHAAALGCSDPEAWDVTYYSEKLRQQQFSISQEQLKPYFPAHRVLDGMFAVVNRLYGLTVTEQHDIPRWHPDVRFFSVHDRDSILRGQFYLDLYARPNKRGGAWMDECILRMRHDEEAQTPVAFLTCNFSPPLGDAPALFTHQEVTTLFHEFGHGLHHMLTLIDHPGISGINGVAWDAVELPSQFMENWCWEPDALPLVSGHYQSGAALPEQLFSRLLAARNFQSGMQMVRQIEFALFDFRLHLEYDPAKGAQIYQLLDEVRNEVAVIRPPSFNRFPHSFSHIFAGGYAAGYYSYKWAEVLSSDAFSLFEERGIFDAETGRQFMSAVLEQGGSREPMEMFIEFRGREPQIDALLRHSGLTA